MSATNGTNLDKPHNACTGGFVWSGQPFNRCDRCGCPAWGASDAALLMAELDRVRSQLKHATERADKEAEAYRFLADKVIESFNPPDGDEDETWICAVAIQNAVQYIESQPCTCEGDYQELDPCPRCEVLGRSVDRGMER